MAIFGQDLCLQQQKKKKNDSDAMNDDTFVLKVRRKPQYTEREIDKLQREA